MQEQQSNSRKSRILPQLIDVACGSTQCFLKSLQVSKVLYHDNDNSFYAHSEAHRYVIN